MLWTLAIIAILYLALLGLVFFKQRAMIYPAPPADAHAWHRPLGLQEVATGTSDGLRLKALFAPPSPRLPVLVFFHGNGDNLEGAYAATSRLAAAGYGLFLAEYRGYGGNPGAPSEHGLYSDGEAALRWLAERGYPPGRIVIIGNSLGSGVASEMAASHPIAGLALVSGFARFSDIAATRFPYFPVRLLLLDRYENEVKLPRVAAPVLILHGAEDNLVPLSQAERLARSAPQARLVVIPRAGHELAYLPQSQAVIGRWLQDLRSQR